MVPKTGLFQALQRQAIAKNSPSMQPSGISILIAATIALGTSMAHGQQPFQDDPRALWRQAVIYRDAWGTPHIYADSPRAQAFAFGYAQAEDHLESMLRAYRVATGRAAEVWGETFAKSDAFMTQMGYALLAQTALAQADALTRDLCEGFALGVNAFIVDHPEMTPPWAEGVRPADVLALLHCYLMSFAPFDLPNAYRFPPAATTGNAWAIAPPRSRSGKAMLVINPHAHYDGPFQWCEAHLVTQDVAIAGATLFGLPIILMGHNAVLGWALTPNQADFADVYLEAMPQFSGSPKAIASPGLAEQINLFLRAQLQPRPYYVRTQDGMQQRSVDCADTLRGPVIGEFRGMLSTYHIGGYRELGALYQLFHMARARNLDEFRAALALQQLPCFHVVYADRDGNIFYLYNAKTGTKLYAAPPPPNQNTLGTAPQLVTDWDAPVPSDDSRLDWGPLVPVNQLPQRVNPPSGYLQACGNPPWAATENSGIARESLPPWLAHDRDTYRAQRVRRLLGSAACGFDDMQTMLFDTLDGFAMTAVPFLLGAANNHPALLESAHPDTPGALDVLKNWDCVADTSSAGMTFFHVWWASLRKTAFAYPREAALIEAVEKNAPNLQPIAIKAASEAARVMRNEFDSMAVPWGKAHRIRRGDRIEPIAGANTGEPLFVASDHVFEDKAWRVTYGYGFAMAVEFADRPRAVSVVPFGASERNESPHYDDQLTLFLQRRLKPAYFDDDDVQRHAERAYGTAFSLRPSATEGRFHYRSTTGSPIEARLTTLLDPPASLQQDQAPFTLFVSAVRSPQDAPVALDIEMRVASTVCAAENLDQLALYAYAPKEGWQPVAGQRLDAARRTFLAHDTIPRTYAVLGPANCRVATTPSEPVQDIISPQHQALSPATPHSPPAMPMTIAEPASSLAVETAAHPESSVGEILRPDPNANVFEAPGFRIELLTPRAAPSPRETIHPSETVAPQDTTTDAVESAPPPTSARQEPAPSPVLPPTREKEPAPRVEPPAAPEFDPWSANQPVVSFESPTTSTQDIPQIGPSAESNATKTSPQDSPAPSKPQREKADRKRKNAGLSH